MCERIPVTAQLPQHLVVLSLSVTLRIRHWMCFIVVLICISLMTNDREHLLLCSLPFIFLFWWSVCSYIFPIFKWTYFSYCWVVEVWIVDSSPSPNMIHASQVFSPSLEPAFFYFLSNILHRSKVFHLSLSSLVFHIFLCPFQTTFAQHKLTSIFSILCHISIL
jgi:hypothetical protein